jgi:hypothetical protein
VFCLRPVLFGSEYNNAECVPTFKKVIMPRDSRFDEGLVRMVVDKTIMEMTNNVSL